MKNTNRLILVTNDDGYQSKGINELVELAKEFGEVVVVAPHKVQSGTSHSVSLRRPLYVKKFEYGYYCTCKPADCVKIAVHELLDRKPDLVLSGINHGTNSSVSAIYSGTIGAAREATLNGIPAIGLSLDDASEDANFTAAIHFSRILIKKALENNISSNYCLNVNIPRIPLESIKGFKICRQTKGKWQEEFDYKVDDNANDYYLLKGEFTNFEPESTDTDEWALQNNYISIVPIDTDITNYDVLDNMQKWKI